MREATKNVSRFERLDHLLNTLQRDMVNQKDDYADNLTCEFESQFTRSFYLKLINKSMSQTETNQFIDYLTCMIGLSMSDEFANYT